MKTYTENNLWLEEADGITTIGLSKFALEELGEVSFVELPALNSKVKKDDVLFVLESNKASGDFASPMDGTVVEVNSGLESNPDPINEDTEGAGWLCRIKG